MRHAPGKTTGDILVPLSVEQAHCETLDAAVARAEFEEVWAVLQALQEQDEVLDDIDDIIHQIAADIRGRYKIARVLPQAARTLP